MPDELRTPHPRFSRARWAERLAGRAVTLGRRPRQAPVHPLRGRSDAALAPAHDRRLARLDGGRRRRRAAVAVLRRGERDVVQLDGPVLELMTESRTRFDQRLSRLGPDVLAPELDARALPAPPARRRPDARDRRRAARPAHDRRHRQHVEGRGLLRGAASTPGGPTGEVSDAEALAIVARVPAADAALRARRQAGSLPAHLRHGRAARARAAGQARDPVARPGRRQPHDLLVPGMSDVTLRRVGHKGADHIAPGNTPASFDAALAADVDMIEFDVLPRDRRAPARPSSCSPTTPST